MEYTCKFDKAWIGLCGQPSTDGSGRCLEHAKVKCAVCGNLATRECEHTGQFVCGVPLCDDCEGYVDQSREPGVWGFLNHAHRHKVKTSSERPTTGF